MQPGDSLPKRRHAPSGLARNHRFFPPFHCRLSYHRRSSMSSYGKSLRNLRSKMGENGKIVNATPGQNAWNRPQNIGLVVGLPTRGKKVGLEWSIFFAYQQFPLNCNRELIVVKGKPVDEARITIAKKAIDS